ncbi:hypothetical protein [Meiothermus granaticius]|nr:hypothetical protein [Meiothermus granaticius]
MRDRSLASSPPRWAANLAMGLGFLLLVGWAQSGLQAHTYLRLKGQTQPVWFICDGLQTPWVVAVGRPNAAGQVSVIRFSKTNPKQLGRQVYGLGQPDPGAGQIYYSLSQGGKAVGFVHAVNPGMLEHPELAFTPPILSLKLPSGEVSCRWALGTRFWGFSSRRSVLITQDSSGQLTYQSFNFLGASPSPGPSLEIRGGKATPGGFTFTHRGYTYSLHTSPDQPRLTVQKAGRLLLSETFIGFTRVEPR